MRLSRAKTSWTRKLPSPRLSPRRKKRKRSSAGKSSPSKKQRTSRHPTALAPKEYTDLDLDELTRIEEADPHTTLTFRYFGIKVYFYGTKSKAQTVDFPNYAPVRNELSHLFNRWCVVNYQEIVPVNEEGEPSGDQLPWIQMFADRTKVLYFHKISELSPKVQEGLAEYVDFMEEHAQAWWEMLHWIGINVNADQASLDLHQQRRSRTEKLIRKYPLILSKLRRIKSFKDSLIQEPGIWPLPARVCYWIWEDPRVDGIPGHGKSLSAQLAELDTRDPERVFWATAPNEQRRIRNVTADVKAKLLSNQVRAKNWIVPGREDNTD
ncbi:hypothetical protein PHYBOEH_011587 [Phytophthora boehmeriae]|uniref:Uncharacterized protein n=1 Tax=Phytophthora boehmeriae TaxID=109152 RepID=A0A8T1VIR8_9STRA|nr:hypothetical protein PHYBOEH_011587 [Phytophthora boehmeriae]